MNSQKKISATIVLYNENRDYLLKSINSFLDIPLTKKLYLIDNSPTNELENIFIHKDVEYFFMNENIGFGAAHNIVIDKIKDYSDYHIVLNPDVSFEPEVILDLTNELNKHENVAMIAPKVLFPNDKHQYTARKYPNFFDLIIRRLNIYKSRIYDQEYRNQDLTKPFFVEYLTGCFQLYKTKDFVKLGGFDKRYFLYMEDVDICKKIDLLGKQKLYYPKVSIIHILKRGSSKNIKLFFYHLSSAFKYFRKW